MRERDIKTAQRCGILERLQAFEQDLLKITGIVPDKFSGGVDFDLSSWFTTDYTRYIIVVPQYDIRGNREDYWGARNNLRNAVVDLAEHYDLYRTEDRIGDCGEHFCFVFRCGKSWMELAKLKAYFVSDGNGNNEQLEWLNAADVEYEKKLGKIVQEVR